MNESPDRDAARGFSGFILIFQITVMMMFQMIIVMIWAVTGCVMMLQMIVVMI